MRNHAQHTTYLILLLLSSWLPKGTAQVPVPAVVTQKPILILDGTLHLGNGTVIQHGVLAMEGRIITHVGVKEDIRVDVARYQLIDASGKHVYPGLISACVRLGLEEITTLRQTRDHSEVGDFNPNTRAITSYNTDSEIIPTLRRNGILLAQITPQSGILSGTSSIVALDGWNWEDAQSVVDDGLHLRWPVQGKSKKSKRKYAEQVAALSELFEDAQGYAMGKDKEATQHNLKLKALQKVLAGSRKLYVHTYKHTEIIASMEFLRARNLLAHAVLVGGDDAWHVANYLHIHNIPVLLSKPHRLPAREDEAIDLPYALPAMLHKRGIMVGLTHTAESILSNLQNLPFVAGTAATYGLGKEVALQMVTQNVAKILGIDNWTGTLEVGKEANVVISKGDILDMRENKLSHAFIRGRTIPLTGKQETLYKRFMEKYAQENALQPPSSSSNTVPKQNTRRR